MVLKINQRLITLALQIPDGKGFVPGTGVSIVRDLHQTFRRLRFRIQDRLVQLNDVDNYASAKLLDLPDTGIAILAALVSLALDMAVFVELPLQLALGTSAASASTLSGSMANVVPVEEVAAGGQFNPAPEWKPTVLTTPSPLLIRSGGGSLYLNLAADFVSGDTTIVNGDVVMTYIDLGKVD